MGRKRALRISRPAHDWQVMADSLTAAANVCQVKGFETIASFCRGHAAELQQAIRDHELECNKEES